MSLPFVLDIAIGLIFIYLILSLLASEIQELLTTIFQWRAVHLKKSIEILLTGGEGTSEVENVKTLVHDLYSNPLIKNINQEAKEGIEAWIRQLTWGIGKFWRTQVRNRKNTVFGKDKINAKNIHSGPSYIPAETFATTLLERIGIPQLSHNLSVLNLKKFIENEIKLPIISLLGSLPISEEERSNLANEFAKGENIINDIINNFKAERITLDTTIKRIESEIEIFIDKLENSRVYLQNKEELAIEHEFIIDLRRFKKNIFANQEELLFRLKPSLKQVIDTLNEASNAYHKFQREFQDIGDKDSEIYKAYEQIDIEIKQTISRLPPDLRNSLSALANRAQIEVTKVEEELKQFRKEVETWFERSMDRASGVYKRNAKGVAFLIGLTIAFMANADTLHIIGRLSKDTSLRNALTQRASQINAGSQDLQVVKTELNQALQDISLPIGWGDDNLKEQLAESAGWKLGSFSFAPLRRFLGWTISGLAISMGASFWFDLLGKIVNVRNTGIKPKSAAKNKAEATEES